MGVYEQTLKNGQTRWYVKANWWDPATGKKAQHCKRGFTSPKDAKTYEMAFLLKHPQKGSQSLTELLQGVLGMTTPQPSAVPVEAPEQHQTFQDVFDEYWATTDTRELTEGTKETKMNMYRQHILPFFRQYELTAITPQVIQQWQQQMRTKTNRQGKPFTDTFLHSVQSQLNAVLNYATRKKYIPFSPMVDLKNMGQKNAPQRSVWSVEDYAKFATIAQQRPKTFMLFELYFWHGLRRGEGLGLRPMDITYNESTGRTSITINTSVDAKHRIGKTKTSSSQRTIELLPTVAEELKQYLQLQYEIQPEQRIFEGITTNRLYKDIEWAITESGVPKIRIHDMRHSHVSLLISSQQYSSTDIARDCGHSSAATTLRTYAHMMPQTRTNIADTLEAMRNKI